MVRRTTLQLDFKVCAQGAVRTVLGDRIARACAILTPRACSEFSVVTADHSHRVEAAGA
jgi:hypothetical protein